MSRNAIDNKVKRRLWLANGGRCALCNKDMTDNYLKRWDPVFFAQMAHIKAYSPKGARADSDDLCNNTFENLILVCPECHKSIDNDSEYFTADYLYRKKSEHEKMVKKALESLDSPQYLIVMYSSSISNEVQRISEDEVKQYLAREKMVVASDPVLLGDSNSEGVRPLESLENNFDRRIRSRVESGESCPICLFASGPMYMLIRLGYLFTYHSATVTVPIRTRSGWQSSSGPMVEYKVNRPNSICKKHDVVLELAISAPDNESEIKRLFQGMDRWVVTTEKPGIDIIGNNDDVNRFRSLCYGILDEIGREYHEGVRIHVIPRLCNALSVAFGMAINPKSHPKLHIYDKVGREMIEKDVICIR